jgi:acetate CoA/acetoacetate CoA-transferase alpha subunit
MAKIISVWDAVAMIPEGASIMFGGFMGCGNPHRLIDELSKSGKGGFTMICNDAAMPLPDAQGEEYYGVAKLIHNKQVKELIATHVGLNPEVALQANAGELDLTLVPQGSFAEMIRAAGAGLGGVITPTGIGTVVADMWHVHGQIEIDGSRYLVEKPLRADIAIISGYKVDRAGNIWYKGTTRNFSVAMATAADLVIVEADNLVEIGEIAPEDVVTSGILVDYIVSGSEA